MLCKESPISDKLVKNLKLFGLNPNNWKIIQSHKSNYWFIVHKKNQSIRLQGISCFKDKSNPYWKTIEMTAF